MVNLLRYFIEIQSSTAEMIKRNYVTINTKLRKEKKTNQCKYNGGLLL